MVLKKKILLVKNRILNSIPYCDGKTAGDKKSYKIRIYRQMCLKIMVFIKELGKAKKMNVK